MPLIQFGGDEVWLLEFTWLSLITTLFVAGTELTTPVAGGLYAEFTWLSLIVTLFIAGTVLTTPVAGGLYAEFTWLSLIVTLFIGTKVVPVGAVWFVEFTWLSLIVTLFVAGIVQFLTRLPETTPPLSLQSLAETNLLAFIVVEANVPWLTNANAVTAKTEAHKIAETFMSVSTLWKPGWL